MLRLVTSLLAGGGSFKTAVTDTLLPPSSPADSVVFTVSVSLFTTEVDGGLRENVKVVVTSFLSVSAVVVVLLDTLVDASSGAVVLNTELTVVEVPTVSIDVAASVEDVDGVG